MRSRIVTSGLMAAAGVVVLGLAAPAFATSTAGTLETAEETVVDETTVDDGDTGDQLGDEIDAAASTVEEEADGLASEGPEPVADTVDTTTDTTTDTTDAVTDEFQETSDEPAGSSDGGTNDQRGAGSDPVTATDPNGSTSAPGGLAAPTGASASDPQRIALDGFRRTSGGNSAQLAVSADPLFEEEPAFAPPTTREVIEPTAAAPPLSLRSVAVEILVATALLVMATGGLVAELGPERA